VPDPDLRVRARSGERIARMCQSANDARALRLQVIEELRG
jgi:hypothetical protein